MQKIKVSRVETKPTSKGGTMVAVFDDKNTRFSGFLKELQDVREGDIIEAEIQVDGKYNNITAVKSVIHGSVVPTPDTPGGDRNRSIERQVAAKVAASLYVPGTVNVEKLLADAEIIARWIAGEAKPPKTEPKHPETESKPPAGESNGVKPGQDKPVSEMTVIERRNSLYQKAHGDYKLTIGQVDSIAQKAKLDMDNPDHFHKVWECIVFQYGKKEGK